MTAMTWPIDLAEELKELDETYDKGADYTQLLLSHLHYKAALLRPGVLQALFAITLPCLARDAKERKEREEKLARGEKVGPLEPDPTEEVEVGCLGLLKFFLYATIFVVLAGKFFTGSYLWELEPPNLRQFIPVRSWLL